jgi:hypothetical protein
MKMDRLPKILVLTRKPGQAVIIVLIEWKTGFSGRQVQLGLASTPAFASCARRPVADRMARIFGQLFPGIPVDARAERLVGA